jgi:hypothetical protein
MAIAVKGGRRMRIRPRKVLGGLALAVLLLLFAQSPSGALWRAFSDLAIDVDEEDVVFDGDRPEVCEQGIRFTVAEVIAQEGEDPPAAQSFRAPDLLAVKPPQGPLPENPDPNNPDHVNMFANPPGTRLIPRTRLDLPLNPITDDSQVTRWYSQEFAFLWSSPQTPGTEIELIFDTGNPEANFTLDQRAVVTVQSCQGNWPTVGVNIRPSSTTNTIDCSVHTSVPVAILSRSGFDARNIVVDSVRVGRRGIEAKPSSSSTGDVDGDGDTDRTVQVPQDRLDCRRGTTSLFVIGKLTNGITFTGSDSVSPVNCPK